MLDFYIKLGSQRLTSLIKEDCNPSKEVENLETATDMHSLILERLPLFLQDHPHAQIEYIWLSDVKNFIVKTFSKLTVTIRLEFGNVHAQQHQDASAYAKQQFAGAPIELWLAGEDDIMYE